MMNSEERSRYVRCMVVFGILITGFLGISVYTLIANYRFRKDGKTAIAVIKDKREYKESTNHSYWVIVVGDSLNSERFIESSLDYRVGDSVSVHFIAEDPKSFRFHERSEDAADILVWFSTIVFGIIFIYCLISPETAVQYFTGDIS
jgi:hypothetical protein